MSTSLQWAVSFNDTQAPVVQGGINAMSHTLLDDRDDRSFWFNSRLATVYVASLSLVTLIIHTSVNRHLQKHASTATPTHVRDNGVFTRLREHFLQYGSLTIAFCKIVRLLSTTALFALTTAISVAFRNADVKRWQLLSEVVAFFYATTLSILTIVVPAPTSRIVSAHATLVTLAFVAMCACRDIWPLMTYDPWPQDRWEGYTLWVRLALAGVSSIVVPVVEPYPYIPLDPANPQKDISPEQTGSIFSFMTFRFLGQVVEKANSVPHLPAEDLPPLRDVDAAPNLAKASAKYLDPHSGVSRTQNIYWGLVRVFPRDWTLAFVSSLLMAAFDLCGPVGINRLLNYIETDGEGAYVRPWVWLLWMGLSPLAVSLTSELYNYYVTQIVVKTDAIIMTTVIEHSLRIRVKAESQTSAKPPITSIPAIPLTEIAIPTVGTVDDEGTFDRGDAATAHSQMSTAVESEASITKDDAATSPTSVPPPAEAEKSTSGKNNLVGRVNNLITSDLTNISSGSRDIFRILVAPPVTVALAMAFLYVILDWSAFVGLAVMIILMPVPARLSGLMEGMMEQKMKATDERVQTITETMGVIRMIKLFGWETRVKQSVAEKRAKEVSVIWRAKKFEFVLDVVNHVLPLLHMVVTYLVYTLVMKRPLSASVVFSAMSAFEQVRMQIFTVTYRLPMLLRARVSIKRLREFLNETELLDKFTMKKSNIPVQSSSPEENIGFSSATFAWSNDDANGVVTPSRRTFRLRIDDELIFHKDAINLIIGPTGSGKTSLLMALLGEMHYIPSGPGSWFNLPRSTGVAYAPQESWVLNATIRENIVFGSPFDNARYEKTLYQCGLERDLQLFDAGDATEVGEKGITLSGGQKARITLARAVYSSTKTLLLDDVLAALDVHTARWIVDNCFKGDLLRHRTVILVTHNVAMASPMASFVVALGADGRVLSQGNLSDALKKDSHLIEDSATEISTEKQDASLEAETVAKPDAAGKLIVEEEVAVGRVGWSAFMLLINALGGSWPILFWLSYLLLTILFHVGTALEMWWLGWWARQYEVYDPSQISIGFYLGIYGIIVLAGVTMFVSYYVIYTLAILRSSRTIHDRLVTSLVGSTFRWLDTTPISRMITRCTQDIQAIDDDVPMILSALIDVSLSMVTKLGIVLVFTPMFVLAGLVLGGIGMWLGSLYMRAQLPVKRELSKAKAPVLATVDSVVAGLTSIRAYAAEDQFRQQAFTRISKQTRIARTAWNLNRWIAFRIAVITTVFSTSLGWYLIYVNTSFSTSNIGFVLLQGMGFSEIILYWIRILNEFQTQGNSLERILAYLEVEQEPDQVEGGQPPAYWPASGDLRVEKLSARYSPDGPKALQDVSFEIKAGQRIGVVGRTGSGKSSLTLSLLRCIYTDGTVYFDGIPTASVNLDALRSKITIIPQAPELLSGTLRRNLDMFEEHDDAVLNDALRAAGLFSLQTHDDENKLSLDSNIASGGGNLSVGQRQIIALARALVRQSKLLILDEATSAIDYETDTIIQESLRKELGSDVTVITIAHRLQTIMDADKIMVLDAGKLVEFDSPKALLQKDKSFLKALVDESSDKDALYAMAEGKDL